MPPFASIRNPLDAHRAVALRFHCRLAVEAAHPRFFWVDPRGYTVGLTVNTGYE
jgi:hypothetical protein